jgi:hypothetical protein
MQNITQTLIKDLGKTEIANILDIKSRKTVYNKIKNDSFTLDELVKLARSKGYTLLLVVSDSITQ